jgi:hypothetical protein
MADARSFVTVKSHTARKKKSTLKIDLHFQISIQNLYQFCHQLVV